MLTRLASIWTLGGGVRQLSMRDLVEWFDSAFIVLDIFVRSQPWHDFLSIRMSVLAKANAVEGQNQATRAFPNQITSLDVGVWHLKHYHSKILNREARVTCKCENNVQVLPVLPFKQNAPYSYYLILRPPFLSTAFYPQPLSRNWTNLAVSLHWSLRINNMRQETLRS